MSPDPHHHTFPLLRFMARYGDLLAAAVAAIGVLYAAWAIFNTLWLSAAVAIGGAALAYVLVRAFGELIRLILDVMHPP